MNDEQLKTFSGDILDLALSEKYDKTDLLELILEAINAAVLMADEAGIEQGSFEDSVKESWKMMENFGEDEPSTA